ncbi:MAG: hypothetical protein JWP73_531 [Phenylobacterium sp.]|nr:hypothetical protein [Phenylobacterium sp.]
MTGRWLAIVMAIVCASTSAPAAARRGDYMREQQVVTVGGTPEIWRLLWIGRPRPFCAADQVEMSLTCPCSGWAYGETGKLTLVRMRNGREVERMDLGGLFGDFDYPTDQTRSGEGYLPRWPEADGDIKRSEDPRLIAEVKRRSPVRIIQPADYDRDGSATEFLIQVGTLPCGKHQFAAIGVSKANPHLHAFGSAAHPNKPLVLPRRAWEALLSSPRPTPILIWECDDHGSEVRSLLEVSAQGGHIRAVDRDYGCPGVGTTGRLIKRNEW